MHDKIKTTLLYTGLLILSCGSQIAAAQTAVYKTVDEQGTTVFTDRPPVDRPAEKLNNLTMSVSDNEALDAEQSEKAEDEKYQQAAEEIRETQQTEDEAFQAAVKDQNEAACRAANARLSKYKSARKLYRQRSDGEREYLNDAELDAERAEASRAVDELCG